MIWPHGVIIIATMWVTGYCDTGIMASGIAVHDGAVACGSSWPFGTEFVLDGRLYT